MSFPLHARKHREPPLFAPTHFRNYQVKVLEAKIEPSPPRVALIFGRRWSRWLTEQFGDRFDSGEQLYRLDRHRGIAHLQGPGGPYAAIVMEELAAIGARQFVIVGMAGSLQPGVRAGDWVVCTRALRDEGTSHHYLRSTKFAYPSSPLTQRLESSLRLRGRSFHRGPSWTTDAAYRETRGEVRRFREAGIQTVEMEAATVFTVAKYLRRDAAALFVVSDHLDEGGWEPRFRDAFVELQEALKFTLDVLGPRASLKRAR
ncbi:MAG TPA: nucleoside phosphorylase [Thermoplasmata archaeon]|nr:nucleoside phosphorylase [Thermoplasmata archaeon]